MKVIELFIINVIAALLYMTVWFYIGKRRDRIDTVDTAWGGGFLLVAIISFAYQPSLRSATALAFVLLWSGRLAWFIWRRAALSGPDPRYDELSDKWPKGQFWWRAYLSIFLTQGLLIAVVSLPLTMIGAQHEQAIDIGLYHIALAGWLVGFACEAVGDQQLKAFIADKRNKGKTLRTGLWRYSRHPNYFGELLQWWMIALLALGPSGTGWFGFIGPIVLTILIVFVSGIPPSERRRKDNPEYQAYKRVTSPLIPLPPKHE